MNGGPKKENMNTAGLFVTGTDTEVGKTYVTCLIAREAASAGVRVGVYKPVCSGRVPGAERWQDVETLWESLGGRYEKDRICPQRFSAPLAPPVAARREGRTVDGELLRSGAAWWEGRVELLLVEGVGGLLCPLTETENVADLAGDLGYPLIVVARRGLGTINHTLLTVEAARRRGLAVAGILFNEVDPPRGSPAEETNPAEVAARCEVPVLGVVPHGGTAGLLQDGRPIRMDWTSLGGRRPDSAETGSRVIED